MDVVSNGPPLPLWSDYQRFVRRHLLLVGTVMTVGFTIGLAWSWDRPAAFSATSSVVLTPVPKYATSSATALVPTEVTIDTDAQLLLSPQVQSAIADELGTDPASAVDHMTVTAAARSHLLRVTITASSPGAAADAANAAAAALIRVRRASLGALALDQLQQLRLLISNQQALTAQTVVLPGVDPLATQILDLTSVLRELEEARRTPASAVEPAVAPRHPDHPNTEVPLTSGAMLGLLCGCLLGAGRDRLGRRTTRAPAGRASLTPQSGGVPDVSTRHGDLHHVR